MDWALGETWAERMEATSPHPPGDGGWVEWTIEEDNSQTLPHNFATPLDSEIDLVIGAVGDMTPVDQAPRATLGV